MRWLAARTSRCLLIEPAGTWSGRWARGVDVDWLLADLASIRERLEADLRRARTPCRSWLPRTRPRRGTGAAERPAAASAAAARRGRRRAALRARRLRALLRRLASAHHRHDRRRRSLSAGARTRAARCGRSPASSPTRCCAPPMPCCSSADGTAPRSTGSSPPRTEAGVIEARLPPTTVPAPTGTSPASRVASAYDVRYARLRRPGAGRRRRGVPRHRRRRERRVGRVAQRRRAARCTSATTGCTPADEMVEFDGLRSDLPRPDRPGEPPCRASVDGPRAGGAAAPTCWRSIW